MKNSNFKKLSLRKYKISEFKNLTLTGGQKSVAICTQDRITIYVTICWGGNVCERRTTMESC